MVGVYEVRDETGARVIGWVVRNDRGTGFYGQVAKPNGDPGVRSRQRFLTVDLARNWVRTRAAKK